MVENKEQGLSWEEAGRRLEQYGHNVLKEKKQASAAGLFMSQFRDVFVIILLAATVASVLLGNAGEAIVIVAIVFLNALLGFVQEYRTERTLEALKKMAAPKARVMREGVRCEIDAGEVVPGDVVLLESGDRIPADATAIEVVSLGCDESMLSGESVPVDKRKNDDIYMGTVVSKGRGKAVVTRTGMQTEMGKIAGMLRDIKPGLTPLQQRMDEMGKWIGIGCLLICVAVSIIGIIQGEGMFDMLMLGISLAVAAIPEGLSAIVTVSLALSVRRILKRNALVRHLHTVETLGCADVICTDKTGTLTENKMTVTEIYTSGGKIAVQESGRGENSRNRSTARDRNVSTNPLLERILQVALLCNNATLAPDDIKPQFFGQRQEECSSGDPTELALLRVGRVFGLEQSDCKLSVCDENPFDPERKMMSVVVQGQREGLFLFTKGAPDVLIERCTLFMTAEGVRPMTSEAKSKFLQENTDMAGRALRVLGFAFRAISSKSDMSEQGLCFVGLIAMMDPPRREAYAAVSSCRHAGIRTVMITGDSRPTACAVATDLKIMTPGDEVLSGAELDKMDNRDLCEAVKKTAVFYRVNPGHKLRIVKAFKARGHIVAMTGDGVNDAPAIKEADIGVAMGIAGTDISREASSMILLDDNFATMVAAVEEGRVIYSNIRKFMRYLISCNIGEVFTMFVGMLMGLPVVLYPIQILLVNLVTDGLPAMALGADTATADVMRRAPRGREESVFSGGLMSKILFRGCMIGLSTLITFTLLHVQTGDLTVARSGALLTLITAQLCHAFECRYETRTIFEISLFGNPALLGAVVISAVISVAVVYHPWLQGLFVTTALSLRQLALVVGVSMFAPLLSSAMLIFERFGQNKRSFQLKK